MKRIYFVIFLLAILASCKREKKIYECEDPIYFGTVNFNLNGFPETHFFPRANYYSSSRNVNKLELSFNKFNDCNYIIEYLGFSAIALKDSTYKIKTSTSQINTISYYGYPTDIVGYYSYLVDSIKDCTLHITKYDSITKEIWGTFNGTYFLPNNISTQGRNLERIATITNGSFYTKVAFY